MVDIVEVEKNKGGRPPMDPWGDKQIAKKDIANIFAEIPPGYSIKVYRIEPEWCTGYLGEIFVDGNTPISVESIKARFGGTYLKLQIVDDSKRFKGQKMIRIADAPKQDYEPVNPNYSSPAAFHQSHGQGQQNQQNQQYQQPGMLPGIPPGVPPHMHQQYYRSLLGIPEPDTKKESHLEMMQAKMMMDMMTAQSAQQIEQQRANTENQRHMFKMQRDMERDSHKEPLGEVQSTITLLRELNGIKGEFGGNDNVVSDVVSQAAPIVETAISELIAMQKLKIQTELARIKAATPPRPDMPNRTPVAQLAAPPTNQGEDPVKLATRMGEMFKNLSDEQQQNVLEAFFAVAEKEEDPENNDNSFAENDVSPHTDNNNLLDEDDQKVLNGAKTDDNESGNVQDSEHPPSA